VLLLFSLYRPLLDWVATLLGIIYPPSLLFGLVFVFLLAIVLHYLGAVLFARNEFDRAEAELVRSLELGGQYLALRPMAFMLLSRIAMHRDDWPTAGAHLEEA
jgi:hypothetical protein